MQDASARPPPRCNHPERLLLTEEEEQRVSVVAELGHTGSAAVNTILGERWKSLSTEQQAKYYQEADAARRRHEQQHPQWSSSDNYGQKRKRRRQGSTAPSSSGGNTRLHSMCPIGPKVPDC
ncbi:transcription factor 7-like 2 [Melanotaenia boesemani]|uniref:transcription factor 7-like 2 n=1 Tax=Melanotaenia boesemani TaxID=1250792 RepID=UPI001C04000B|nr:transcription factor 7-like 2 [Melanotaenia boesemani]